jgi:hypothetical protein
MLSFSFFFFAEISCPFELSRVPSKIQRALSAFACAEPQDRSIIPDVHHSCTCWKFAAAK